MKAHIKRHKELSATKRYRITDGFNFLYLASDGFPKWRDEEYSSTFHSVNAARNVIDGCGYQHDADIRVVEA